MADAGIPTEALQLPPEHVMLKRETLTVGPPLEDENSVNSKYGLEGLSLVSIADIPVGRKLEGTEPHKLEGTRPDGPVHMGIANFYIFQAGQEGARELLEQVAGFPDTYPNNRLEPGDVRIIEENDLAGLVIYKQRHPNEFDKNEYDTEVATVPTAKVIKDKQVILGREAKAGVRFSERLTGHPDAPVHLSSREHLTVKVSPDGKVSMIDTSTNGTRVAVRPGYRKAPAPQTTPAS